MMKQWEMATDSLSQVVLECLLALTATSDQSRQQTLIEGLHTNMQAFKQSIVCENPTDKLRVEYLYEDAMKQAFDRWSVIIDEEIAKKLSGASSS